MSQRNISAPSESNEQNQKIQESSGNVPLNPNYKTIIRIKPSESQTKSLESTTNTITLKEKPPQSPIQNNLLIPTSKDKEETLYKFTFNQILDQNTNQESVYKSISENSVNKLVDGQNACIIAYGQTNAGKSYTIFGEDEHFSTGATGNTMDLRKDKKGLVSRSLEYILIKAKDLEDIREFTISASFFEQYLDQVRDLGKGLTDKHNAINNYESESLEIQENNNNGQLKGLTVHPIKHMNDLYDLLTAGFSLREKAEAKGNQLSNRSHTILLVILNQKDKENENLPLMSSSICFVDLAGSERLMKGGAGNDTLKNKENIIINSNLTALGKCLLSIAQTATKNIPYKESKLTRILQNSLTSISNVCFFAHVIHSEANFEENLNTLRFADRTKNTDLKGRLSMLDESGFGFGSLGSSDKMIKKLNEEINDCKSKLESLQKEYRQKMSELQKILGLDVDLDKLISKPNEKDLKNFKLQREALKELDNIKTIKKDLEDKIEKQYKKMEVLRIEQKKKEDKYWSQITKLKDLNKQLKEQISISKTEGEDNIKTLNKQRSEDIKHIIVNSNMQLDEKCHPLLFRQNIMENIQNEKTKLLDAKQKQFEEDQKIYGDKVTQLKSTFQNSFKTLKEQHEILLEEKNNELQNLIDQSNTFLTRKREERELYKTELLDLNEIALKNHNLIEKIEQGDFSAGIKSFNIPQKEKPIYPNKLKHSLLHKYLEQKQMMKLTKASAKEALKPIEDTKDATKTVSSSTKQKTTTAFGFDLTQTELARIESNVIDVNVNVNKLNDKDLQRFCLKLQEKLKSDLKTNKELEERFFICEEIKKNHDINSLIKERDEYRVKYLAEWKKNNQSRIVLESQKRLITSPSFIISTKSKTDYSSKLRSSTSDKKYFIKSTSKF